MNNMITRQSAHDRSTNPMEFNDRRPTDLAGACAEKTGLSGRAKSKPRVSIGLPVHNGEAFLPQALDSLLEQRFDDFELLISDNASTDATPIICRRYEAYDPRIRVLRNELNRGAAWNFNRLVELATGEYFMWASHDDLWDKSFLEIAVPTLDANPRAVLCYGESKEIDAAGRQLRSFYPWDGLSALQPHKRFAAAWRYPPHLLAFGLIRTTQLRRTRLIGAFPGSDRILVSELALLGPCTGIRRQMFSYRRHPEQSTGHRFPTKESRAAWFDPTLTQHRNHPQWRLLTEHYRAIRNAPIAFGERMMCILSLLRWVIRQRRRLAAELLGAHRTPSTPALERSNTNR